MTEYTQSSFSFFTEFQRDIVARFDGGALLLHGIEQKTSVLWQFAGLLH